VDKAALDALERLVEAHPGPYGIMASKHEDGLPFMGGLGTAQGNYVIDSAVLLAVVQVYNAVPALLAHIRTLEQRTATSGEGE
jgi:hypothetical protein